MYYGSVIQQDDAIRLSVYHCYQSPLERFAAPKSKLFVLLPLPMESFLVSRFDAAGSDVALFSKMRIR